MAVEREQRRVDVVVPRLDEARKERLDPIPGMPPDLIHLPPGCPFYARCTYREPRNRLEMPPLREVGPGHEVACWVDIRTTKPHDILDETALAVGGEHELLDHVIEDETEVTAVVASDSRPRPDAGIIGTGAGVGISTAADADAETNIASGVSPRGGAGGAAHTDIGDESRRRAE